MELADLNQDERTALVGLMKLIVMSDGEVSEDEIEHVEVLVGAFGEERVPADARRVRGAVPG